MHLQLHLSEQRYLLEGHKGGGGGLLAEVLGNKAGPDNVAVPGGQLAAPHTPSVSVARSVPSQITRLLVKTCVVISHTERSVALDSYRVSQHKYGGLVPAPHGGMCGRDGFHSV